MLFREVFSDPSEPKLVLGFWDKPGTRQQEGTTLLTLLCDYMLHVARKVPLSIAIAYGNEAWASTPTP